MPETPFISAIVLAAGASSRMGSAKQLLRLGERTLIEHALANVRGARGVGEIVVVLGAAAGEIRAVIERSDGAEDGRIKIVMNEDYAEGMGRSLQCGLRAAAPQAQAILVVLADQPLVKSATVGRLIEDYAAARPQILIPLYRGFRGNPVLIDRSVFPEIAALKGDTGCRAVFGAHLENIRKLEVDDPGVVLDADRPSDLEIVRGAVATGRFDLEPMETRTSSASAKPYAAEVIVAGREGVARAVAKFAHDIGYSVTVVDPLATFEDAPEATTILRVLDFSRLPVGPPRFCVVASMGHFDEEAIEQGVAAGIGYVALVANKKRSEEVLRSLTLRGGSSGALEERVRTKPGLPIGAQTPEEIALSIVGEIVNELRRGA